jgi:hypothetical protein
MDQITENFLSDRRDNSGNWEFGELGNWAETDISKIGDWA